MDDIVVYHLQRAAASGVTIGFWDHFRVGAPLTLLTLPEREYRGGMAEAVKHGLIGAGLITAIVITASGPVCTAAFILHESSSHSPKQERWNCAAKALRRMRLSSAMQAAIMASANRIAPVAGDSPDETLVVRS